MDNRTLQTYHCRCEKCQMETDHPKKRVHDHINLLMSRMNEQQRRWLAALLAEDIGLRNGGVRQASQLCGVGEKTIRRGLKELERSFVDLPIDRMRQPGAGRRKQNKRLKAGASW